MIKLFNFILLVFLVTGINAQNVTNADSRQEGKKIIITYTLDKPADISVYCSMDGGKTFGPALQKVTGDVGRTVPAGCNTIVWDVLAEVNELQGENIAFKIKAMRPLKTYEEFMMMSDNNKEEYLYKMGLNDIYKKFHRGRSFNSGRLFAPAFLFTTLGGACTMLGLIPIIVNMAMPPIDKEAISNWHKVLYPGVASLGIGISFCIMFNRDMISILKMEKAEKMYKKYYSKRMQTAYLPTLNFGLSQNGFGAILKF
ncbi:MAG: hypothetical protein BWY70_01378 [Bacteroidetes bacterium ADurb.Bin408]|nr:MAG: hypothetical protein BWY70_01378 [Bacteroidetes bacterium ADurb.Bin408]